jgi:hypothetical protein
VAPATNFTRTETNVVLTTNVIIVTNVVPVTNLVPVTSLMVVTNAVTVTNAMIVTNIVPVAPFVYEQRPLTGRPVLVTPEQAKAIIERFRAGYAKLGNPRMLIYINRELVDDQTGMKLSGRSERTEQTRVQVRGQFKPESNAPQAPSPASNTVSVSASGNVTVIGDIAGAKGQLQPGKGEAGYQTERVTGENTYRLQERRELTLADKQTVRDVERLFGRPLRLGGVSLADQWVATQLIGDKPLKAFTTPTEGEAARKDREALATIADVVLEVLISSRNVVAPEVSGDKVYQVPDIQATAIRLSDSKILGQATAADIIGKDRFAGRIARNFDVRDIAEATALSLMEDMMLGIGQ